MKQTYQTRPTSPSRRDTDREDARENESARMNWEIRIEAPTQNATSKRERTGEWPATTDGREHENPTVTHWLTL